MVLPEGCTGTHTGDALGGQSTGTKNKLSFLKKNDLWVFRKVTLANVSECVCVCKHKYPIGNINWWL